jgi:DNA-binding transcriptional ArsR family regulator
MMNTARKLELPHPIPEHLAMLIAERFRILADPTRLRLLDMLRTEPATIGAIAERLDTTQQNVSKHIKLLGDAGIVKRERRGTSVVCSIADNEVFALCESVCSGIERSSLEIQALFNTGAQQ